MEEFGRHLNDEQITWAIIDPEELPELARKHLSLCEECRDKARELDRVLGRISDMATKCVPTPDRYSFVEARKVRRPFIAIGHYLRGAGLSLALAGILLVIISGALVFRQYRQSEQLAAIAEEVQRDAMLMAEVDRLIENPLPSLYEDISGEDSYATDRDFMDFIIPEVNPGKQGADNA